MSELVAISSVMLEFDYEQTVCPFELSSTPDTRAAALGFETIVATDAATGQPIATFAFHEENPSTKRVLYGMSSAESWGAWSSGRSTAVMLYLPPHAGAITLHLNYRIPLGIATDMTVVANGETFGCRCDGSKIAIAVNHPLAWREPASASNVSLQPTRPDLSIIIPNYDRPELVYLAVRAIARVRTSSTYEVIVVENGSSPACMAQLEAFGLPADIVRHERPASFASVNNIAVERARGEYVLFLNNDAFIADGLFEGLIEALQDEEAGAAGPTFLNMDGSLQEVGARINVDATTIPQVSNRPFADIPRISSVDYISAACLALRRNDFLSLGGFDPVYRPAYCEDADLALRIRATGKRIRLVRDVFVRHVRNATSQDARLTRSTHDAIRRNTATLRSRYGAWLASRDDDDLPHPIALRSEGLQRQAARFSGETLNCVSVDERVVFGSASHSTVAIASVLSELHPTALAGPEPLSLLELCSAAERFALPHDRLATATFADLGERDVDVHVLSSRAFPCVAPAQGHIRILHCPAPVPPRDDELQRYQRRVGGLLNFDAVIVDSEPARQACLAILAALGAPGIPIDVLPPPSIGALPVRAKEKLILSLGPLTSGPGGGLHERVLGALRLASMADCATGWRIVIAGDLAHDEDLDHLAMLSTVSASPDAHLVVNPTPMQVLELIAKARVYVAAASPQAAASASAPDRFAPQSTLRSAIAAGCVTVVPAEETGAPTPGGSPAATFATIDGMATALRRALEQAENRGPESPVVDPEPDRSYRDAWLALVAGCRAKSRSSGGADRPAFVVLGAHRSGTSAMARVLSLAGAELPNDLMPPMPDNPRGFWEPLAIANLNDALLEGLGSRWDDVFGYAAAEAQALPGSHQDAGRACLRSNFSGRRPIVLKDPRISLLVETWQEWLRAEGYDPAYVIMVRHPLEVADSLTRRNALSGSRGLMLWASYTVACLRATRGLRRVFVQYDDLIADPLRVMRLITEGLAVHLASHKASASEIRSFVDPALRNHRVSDALPAPFARVQALHEALTRQTHDDLALERAVDDVHHWLEELRALVTAGCFAP